MQENVETQNPNLTKSATQRRQLILKELNKESKERRSRIDKEFANGFELLHEQTDTVTIFGSARFTEDHPYYIKAREIATMLVQEGYTVITGGGGGIMEAGNRGAFEAGGKSIGLNIELPHEQALNPYTTASLPFKYFFARKVLLAYEAQAYIFLPGGFGTLDEFFEIITLIQTKKVEPVPIVLVGHEFWQDLDNFIRFQMLEGFHTISPDDEKLYTITEDPLVIKEILDAHRRRQVMEILTNDANQAKD